MFLLFSSNSEPRYKRNVLDVLCYPERQIVRFRYREEFVSPLIRRWRKGKGGLARELGYAGRIGLSVYAEIDQQGFNFFPVRFVELVRISPLGNLYFVDVRLGPFFDLGSELAR